MEGYLKKYINFLKGWKKRYFILHEDTLVYCEGKGGKTLGQLHLKVCSIQQSNDEVLLIIVNSGTKELKIKAKDIKEKVRWISALQQAQEQIIKNSKNIIEVMQNDQQIGSEFKKYFKESRLEKVIQQQMAEVWSFQAELDSKCKDLQQQQQFILSNELKSTLDSIVDLTSKIKQKVADTYKELEYENKQLYYLAKNIQKNTSKNKSSNQQINNNNNNNNNNDNNDSFDEFDSLDLNNYESFIIKDEDDQYYHEQQEMSIYKNDNQQKYSSVLEKLRVQCAFKYQLVSENRIFIDYQISEEERREILPNKKDPSEKLNIFNLLKDAIGKDLTKFAVPVYLNEPLSMLQRLCEQFEYAEVLEAGAKQEKSCMRLAFVMAFALSITASTIGRIKKPFNPLLSETYELIDNKKNFRFISEQVSHHPPISAGYAESQHFKYWGQTNVKTQFWGKSMEIKPIGSTNILLIKTDDHITYTKAKTSVNNIIIGKTYIDHFGEMIFINHTTNENGVLNLKQRGWRDRGAFEVEGEIKDHLGNIKLKLIGRWDEKLLAIDPLTNQETILWQRSPLPQNYEDYYFFTDFTKQLNLLNLNSVLKICKTDSRLRPDQRALETQNLSFAGSEKLRLEEKQRNRRKEYATINKHHEPVWFKEQFNEKSKEQEYVYKGGYFEARQTQIWPVECLDLY